MSCLPCAAQSHPQGPGQGRGAPPSDGLFVHGSPLVPAPPVSAPIPLEWARQGQGSPSTPAERTEAKIKDMTFSRPQRSWGGAILRLEVPWSERRLVASAPPPPTCWQCRGPHHPHLEKQEGSPLGERPLMGKGPLQTPSPPEGGPSVGWKRVHGNCSAELAALPLAAWRHVVLKMPGSWKA